MVEAAKGKDYEDEGEGESGTKSKSCGSRPEV